MGVRGHAGNSSFLGEDLQGGLRDSFSDRSWHPLLDALNKCRQALHEGVCPALGLRLLDDRGAIVTSTPYLDDVGVSVCHEPLARHSWRQLEQPISLQLLPIRFIVCAREWVQPDGIGLENHGGGQGIGLRIYSGYLRGFFQFVYWHCYAANQFVIFKYIVTKVR